LKHKKGKFRVDDSFETITSDEEADEHDDVFDDYDLKPMNQERKNSPIMPADDDVQIGTHPHPS
jgi:hypothetical protein